MTEDPPSTQEPTVAPAAQPIRRLRRRINGSLGGVASGIADYLGIDPIIIRLAFVILAIAASGGGILLYGALWLLLADQTNNDPRPVAFNDSVAPVVLGSLALLGAASLTFGTLTIGSNDELIVGLLIGSLGFFFLNQRAENNDAAVANTAPFTAAPAPPADPRFGDPSAAPGTFETPGAAAFVAPPMSMSAPDSTAVPPASAPPAPNPPTPAPPTPTSAGAPPHWATPIVAPTPVPTAPKPPVTSVTLAVAAVSVGILLAIDQISDADVGAASVFGAFAAICGLGLVASAFIGRARPLIPIGLLALVGLGLAPLIDAGLGGGFGPREYNIVSMDDLRPTYEVGGGYLDLDLRRLELTEDRTVELAVGGGYAEIVVPSDVNVIVIAESGAGYVDVFGREQSGVNVAIKRSADGAAVDGPTLTIDATVTFGYVEVRRG